MLIKRNVEKKARSSESSLSSTPVPVSSGRIVDAPGERKKALR